MRVSFWRFNFGFDKLSLLYQVLIYGTYVFPQLRHFLDMFWLKIAEKSLYTANIREMRLKLAKLQEWDKEAKSLDRYKKVDEMLHYQGLFFIPEIIQIQLISQYYNNLLVRDFGINKTRKLIGMKYYWPSIGKKLKIMTRAITFVWLWKQSNKNFIVICMTCQY